MRTYQCFLLFRVASGYWGCARETSPDTRKRRTFWLSWGAILDKPPILDMDWRTHALWFDVTFSSFWLKGIDIASRIWYNIAAEQPHHNTKSQGRKDSFSTHWHRIRFASSIWWKSSVTNIRTRLILLKLNASRGLTPFLLTFSGIRTTLYIQTLNMMTRLSLPTWRKERRQSGDIIAVSEKWQPAMIRSTSWRLPSAMNRYRLYLTVPHIDMYKPGWMKIVTITLQTRISAQRTADCIITL